MSGKIAVRRSKAGEVTKRTAKTQLSTEVHPGFDMTALYHGILTEVAKVIDTSDTVDDVNPMSTGSLMYDIVVGGGLMPAMYTNFGPEQSAKTTGALLALVSALHNKLPIVSFWDAEGSTRNSIPYLLNIVRTFGLNYTRDQLFGKRDEEGNWIQRGMIHYNPVTLGRTFFNWFASVLNRMPDKVKVGGTWYLRYPNSKEFFHHRQYACPRMAKRKDGIYIVSPNGGGLAGVVIVDSWPNLQPSQKDMDEEDNALAAAARMFSKNFPRVKGLLTTKKIALIGVNQLRDVPMAMFGPKEREPGGQALRFNSDVRVRFYPRALSSIPHAPTESKTKKGFEVEQSIDGGVDAYRYIHIRAIKNKLAPAERESYLRIWVRDDKGQARGIDPVFDTIEYLFATGQLKGPGRKALTLHLDGFEPCSKKISWADLKLWILGTKEEMKELSLEYGLGKPIPLRAFCFRQMEKGRGEFLYNEAVSNASSVPKSAADSEA